MPVSDYDASPNKNTAISGINIAEGCPPGNVNDAIRQMMADIKIMSAVPLPDATTSAKGVVMLAQTSDTTSTTKSATPAGVKAAVNAAVDAVLDTMGEALDTMGAALAELTPERGFTQSFGVHGWSKLPNGLILQWGKYNAANLMDQMYYDITFPIAFPNACVGIYPVAFVGHPGTESGMQVSSWAKAKATLYCQVYVDLATAPPGFCWFAVGN